MNCKVVIGGCRSYDNYDVFCKFVDMCLSRIKNTEKITIISGHCSGVDLMAEKYAKQNRYSLEIYPAEWKKYGKSAGPRRNKVMVEKANYVIAFWDNKSRGTRNLIEIANKLNKPIRIKYIYKQTPD